MGFFCAMSTAFRQRSWLASVATVRVVMLMGLSGTPSFAQVTTDPTTTFQLREVLSIGDDETAPAAYLLTGPRHIRTDADGRIYVAEPRRNHVRVFGPEGPFLGALGRSGQGPGEFTQLGAIALDADGRLVAYDRMLQRFTRFPPLDQIDSFPLTDPEQLETFPNPEAHMIHPAFMYGLPNGRFVLFYQPIMDDSLDQPRLHVYDDSLRKVEAFGPPTEWTLPDDAVARQRTKYFYPFNGSHVAPGQSSVLLAPHFYNGILHRYAPTGEGTWALQLLEGRDPGHPTHTVLAHKVYARTERPSPDTFLPNREMGSYAAMSMSLPDGRQMLSAFLPRSKSLGVGQRSDGRVVHLSTSEDADGVRRLQIEVFGPNGQLQDVGRIKGFGHETGLRLRWVDRKNRLYLVDHRSGFPVLRVVELVE